MQNKKTIDNRNFLIAVDVRLLIFVLSTYEEELSLVMKMDCILSETFL